MIGLRTAPLDKILPLMHPARRRGIQGAGQESTRPFLTHCYNRPQGGSYCYDGIIKDCRAVEERASPGATATVRIECGAGRVCRSLRRQRSVKEEDASSFERQGPSRNPPGAKGAMGKSQGREKVAAGRRRFS